jgi:hypothetical protein
VHDDVRIPDRASTLSAIQSFAFHSRLGVESRLPEMASRILTLNNDLKVRPALHSAEKTSADKKV